jgi:hypothetical protein
VRLGVVVECECRSMTNVTVGFGTAAFGGKCFDVVLDGSTRPASVGFDTAEADWWYDQKATGAALQRVLHTELGRR